MLAADEASCGLGVELLERGEGTAVLRMTVTPAGADITFVTPAYEGDVLVARTEERTRNGCSGLYDVTVLRGDEVIAEFRDRSRSIRGTTSKEWG
nr:hypothetical protein [Streptomyces swartbergensis]